MAFMTVGDNIQEMRREMGITIDELSLWDGKINDALQYMVKILHIVPYRRRAIISL